MSYRVFEKRNGQLILYSEARFRSQESAFNWLENMAGLPGVPKEFSIQPAAGDDPADHPGGKKVSEKKEPYLISKVCTFCGQRLDMLPAQVMCDDCQEVEAQLHQAAPDVSPAPRSQQRAED